MPYIISKLSANTDYVVYGDVAGGKKVILKHILIKGGAGVTDKKTLLLPNGFATEVSEEDLALLEKNQVFQIHLKNGHITVMKKAGKYEAQDKAENAKDLQGDKSRQQTLKDLSADFEEDESKGAKVLKKKKKQKNKRFSKWAEQ